MLDNGADIGNSVTFRTCRYINNSNIHTCSQKNIKEIHRFITQEDSLIKLWITNSHYYILLIGSIPFAIILVRYFKLKILWNWVKILVPQICGALDQKISFLTFFFDFMKGF